MRKQTLRPTTSSEDWKRVIKIIDQAYAEYLARMRTLRKQVIARVERKLPKSRGRTRRAP